MSQSGGDNDEVPGQAWFNASKQIRESLNDLQRQQEERQRKAAADPRYHQDSPGFAEAVAQWALRDRWTISEAANLFCRCEPSRPTGLPGHSQLDRQVRDMRETLRRSALGREGKGDEALIEARAVIAWARDKGLALPDGLVQRFPDEANQSPTTPKTTQVHGNSRRYAAQREAVLRAAVAVLARYRHQCLDANGQPTGAAIARLIEVHQATLFENGEAPQTADQMARHVREALKLWDSAG